MPSTPDEKNSLYEYAVIRYVPSIEREEFVNIGLIMMCKRRGWLRVELAIDPVRIQALFPEADLALLSAQARSFERVGLAMPGAGPIAQMPAHERFRWLTAVRSACLQTSRPHPGLCADLDATFSRLFASMVLL
ncbi:MAG: DUF3037 domain-containing protein [Muribaculaceae bacterium]|nr:DUF3037 domain-containing protein [Muribaculaceae bacterium]